MKQKTKKIFMYISAVMVACLLTFAVLYINTRKNTPDGLKNLNAHFDRPGNLLKNKAPQSGSGASDAGGEEDMAQEDVPPGQMDVDMIAYIRNHYGDTIFHGHTQIKAIEKAMEYLMHQYPDDWETRMYDFLKAMFPDMADQLYDKFNKLSQYNEWLKSNRDAMAQMTSGERRDMMWNTRYQIFGDDAYVIWESELKNEQIIDAVDKIARSKDSTLDEKLDLYMNSVKAAYGDMADRFIQKRQTELMDKFLSVSTVQENLASLPDDKRREKLTAVRKAMGLDNEAIKRWDDLDTVRDRSWDAGRSYMAERNEIINSLQGEEQQQKLKELQDKLFNPKEAEIIREEEQAGFFRFNHQRIYGKE